MHMNIVPNLSVRTASECEARDGSEWHIVGDFNKLMTFGFYHVIHKVKLQSTDIPDILLSPQQRWMSVGALSKCMT